MTLSKAQIDKYNRDGYIVVEGVLSPSEVAHLSEVTDEFVENSRTVTQHTDVYDLEPGHSAENPRVRRINFPHKQHEAYKEIVRHKGILAIMQDLLGPAVKFDTSKLNMKPAGGGSAVEWHQDWAFYPATNDDLCAVGVMMDDCALENGPLMILPGSHKGPVYDHHVDGKFIGGIDPGSVDIDFSKAEPCLGPAGSISIHHVRAVHGSAPNVSPRTRRLFLLQYRAADAWPLVSKKLIRGENFEKFMADDLVCGEYDPFVPRMKEVPVRLPLPAPVEAPSIFERHKQMRGTYFTNPTSSSEAM